jgi:hypothetical protein
MPQTLCCNTPVHVRAWTVYPVYDLSRANPAILHSVKTCIVSFPEQYVRWEKDCYDPPMQSLILSDVHFFELECCSSPVSETDRTDLLGLTRTEPKTNPVPIENGMPTRKNSSLDIPAHISSLSPTTTSMNDRVLFGVFAEFDAFVKHQAVNVMEKTIAPSTNIQNINMGDVNVPWVKDSGRRAWVVTKDSLWVIC